MQWLSAVSLVKGSVGQKDNRLIGRDKAWSQNAGSLNLIWTALSTTLGRCIISKLGGRIEYFCRALKKACAFSRDLKLAALLESFYTEGAEEKWTLGCLSLHLLLMRV